MPAERTHEALESLVRAWLTALHMDSADIDCVVGKAKALPAWQLEPPELVLRSADGTKFARECGVEISELYVEHHD